MTEQPDTPSAREWLAEKQRLVAISNRVRVTLTGKFSEIQALVDDHDLVWGVWPDPTEPDGVGMMIVKGANMLRDVIAVGVARKGSVTAIPCTSIEQAEALRRHVGEPGLQ